MLLSPLLRKIMTAALILPAGVIATSSYADCSSAARDIPFTQSEWSVAVETDRSKSAMAERHEEVSRSGKRLSRQAFYGDDAPAAVIGLSTDR